MKMHRQQAGFTIVELLIVIVVIGILAALVITTFTGIQQKARDTERETDIKALYGQVEAYYAQNGKYPALAQINDPTWRQANMKGLDQEALRDPKNTSYNLAQTPAANVYAYNVLDATGATGCDNGTSGGADCTQYTLTATLEAGGTFSKSNLN